MFWCSERGVLSFPLSIQTLKPALKHRAVKVIDFFFLFAVVALQNNKSLDVETKGIGEMNSAWVKPSCAKSKKSKRPKNKQAGLRTWKAEPGLLLLLLSKAACDTALRAPAQGLTETELHKHPDELNIDQRVNMWITAVELNIYSVKSSVAYFGFSFDSTCRARLLMSQVSCYSPVLSLSTAGKKKSRLMVFCSSG